MRATRLEKPKLASVIPGLPDPVDLSDVWLAHALACLLDACEVPEADRLMLFEYGLDALEPEIPASSTGPDEPAWLARIDACRRALVFAALALEARLNRALSRCCPDERRAVARLAPAERFRLARRLLAGPEVEAGEAELDNLVLQVFASREELAEADESEADPSERFNASRARAMVWASAKVCRLLANLAGAEESGTARLVQDAAESLARQADLLSAIGPPSQPSPDWYRNGFVDFPPNITGS